MPTNTTPTPREFISIPLQDGHDFARVPLGLAHLFRGLDRDGDLVIADPDLTTPDSEYLIVLTPCCAASDKDGDTGIVCRTCHRSIGWKHGVRLAASDLTTPVNPAVSTAHQIVSEAIRPNPSPTALKILSEIVRGHAEVEVDRVIAQGMQLAWLQSRGWTIDDIREFIIEATS